MKGRLGVGVKATPSPTTTTTSGGGGGTPAATCTNPQSTTVTVDEYEYGFQLTPGATIPCGTVTFKQSNSGSVAHNFALEGVPGGTGAVIDPGQSTTFTVTLTPANYTYICDVSGHAQLGMLGTLTVTG
jgi:plastocyanin